MFPPIFFEKRSSINLIFKGAEATCVKLASEMKKYSRLKSRPNFNIQIFSPYKHVLAALFRNKNKNKLRIK